jgi:hypothetical protein
LQQSRFRAMRRCASDCPWSMRRDYRALPSDIAQEVIQKLAEAWKSFRALRLAHAPGTLKHKPGLPRYRKNRDGTRPFNYIPIKSARSYAVTDTVSIALPAELRSQGRLSMKYVGCERYRGAKKRAELLWDKARERWYLKYAVEVADKVIHGSNRGAAIDLGVRIAASLSIEGVEQARHFVAREMLKDWDYWGRRIAQAHAGAGGPGPQVLAPALAALCDARCALAPRVAGHCARNRHELPAPVCGHRVYRCISAGRRGSARSVSTRKGGAHGYTTSGGSMRRAGSCRPRSNARA